MEKLSVDIKNRKMLVLVIAGLCLAGSLYLDLIIGILSLYILLGLSFLTILIPLTSALYLYRGKFARFWLILAVFAFLSAVIFTVDASATQATFKTMCEDMPEYLYENRGIDGYSCFMSESAPYFRMSSPSSDIGGILYFPYVLSLFINVLHIPYIVWRIGKGLLRK